MTGKSAFKEGPDAYNSGGGAASGVQSVLSGDGIQIDNTDPQNPVIATNLTSGNGITLTVDEDGQVEISAQNDSNSLGPFVNPSSVAFSRESPIDLVGNETYLQEADPAIYWDSTVSKWIMFFWRSLANVLSSWKALSSDLITWEAPIKVADLVHKWQLLEDGKGNAVKFGGFYHAYAAIGIGGIKHFVSTSLNGAWDDLGSALVPASDEYRIDDPCPILLPDNRILMIYMAYPNSVDSYGYSSRAKYSIQNTLESPFVLQGIWLYPSNIIGFKYGWVGGVQIIYSQGNTYAIVNFGEQRAGTQGAENPPTRIFISKVDNILSQQNANTYDLVFDTYGSAMNIGTCWRGRFVCVSKFNQWQLFYNAGQGVERIYKGYSNYTYIDYPNSQRASKDYVFASTNPIMLPGMAFFLKAGRWKFSFSVNLANLEPSPSSGTDFLVELYDETHSVILNSVVAYCAPVPYQNFDVTWDSIISLDIGAVVYLRVTPSQLIPDYLHARWFKMNALQLVGV